VTWRPPCFFHDLDYEDSPHAPIFFDKVVEPFFSFSAGATLRPQRHYFVCVPLCRLPYHSSSCFLRVVVLREALVFDSSELAPTAFVGRMGSGIRDFLLPPFRPSSPPPKVDRYFGYFSFDLQFDQCHGPRLDLWEKAPCFPSASLFSPSLRSPSRSNCSEVFVLPLSDCLWNILSF